MYLIYKYLSIGIGQIVGPFKRYKTKTFTEIKPRQGRFQPTFFLHNVGTYVLCKCLRKSGFALIPICPQDKDNYSGTLALAYKLSSN